MYVQKKRVIFLGLQFLLAIAVLPLHAQLDRSPINPGGSETYKNVLGPRMADPWIIKMGEFYYLYGTPTPGINTIDWTPMWKSRDMVNWSGPYKVYRSTTEGAPHWAGEGYHYRGKYWLLSMRGKQFKYVPYALLSSDSPEGPYTIHSRIPNNKTIDPHIFVDTDGKSYFITKYEYILELNADWDKLLTDWSQYDFGVKTAEGAFVIKHNNHNVFSSTMGGPENYRLMMGHSDAMLGNYTHFPDIIYDGVNRPGHGGYTVSPDGTEMWLTSHYWDKANNPAPEGWDLRWLMIDKWGGFDNKGEPNRITQSFTDNPVPSRSIVNGNIAISGKPVNASDYSDLNMPSNAADNDLTTMWVPANEILPKWLEVDVSGEFRIKSIETTFKTKGVYKYIVEGSYERFGWTTLVDQSSNTTSATIFTDNAIDQTLARAFAVVGRGTPYVDTMKYAS
jgi:hypothetical protein